MLFITQSLADTYRRLWSDFDSDKIDQRTLYRRLLELNSNDFIGLVGTGKAHWEDGNLAAAEEYYWRAIVANPCASEPYTDLSRMLHSDPASRDLATGLAELGILKRSREEDGDTFLNNLDYQKIGMQGEDLDQFLALSGTERARLVSASMQQNRENEPEAVTVRLRPFRLIEQLREDVLDSRTVDAIIAEAPAIVPLLVAVIRAWARNPSQEEGGAELENALALLGETGSPDEIPHLLELVDLQDEIASGASDWALGRIIERHPLDSAKFVESIAPGLRISARLKIAELTLRYPEFDPSGKLVERLSDNLEGIEKEDRDTFFPLLLITMVTARGRLGVSTARAALRHQSGLLSRAARRECEDLLADWDDDGFRPGPPPRPSLTVYDICAGEATWDEDSDDSEADDQMDDDLFLVPPEPVRRKTTPGRNDPCWCNSGKKYKKCHLNSDESEARELPDGQSGSNANEFSHLRTSLGEFLDEAIPAPDVKLAFRQFLGDEEEIEADESVSIIDWVLHDWISPHLGRTVMKEFLIRRGFGLSAREREMVEAWSRSFVGLYEIQELKAGTGGELKDLIFGGTHFVHDVTMSKSLAKWDVILARVVPGERGTELAGAPVRVPRMHLEKFREWMDEDQRNSGLEWQQYLKENWPRIRRQTFEIGRNWLDSLRLSNTDGEELVLLKATYGLTDEVAAIGALQLCPDFKDDSREDEPAAKFAWLNDKSTLLGNIEIANGELVLECNSRQRMERGRRLISDVAGTSLEFLREEVMTQDEVKRGAGKGPAKPPEISDEILGRALEQHYKSWLDTKIPALDGRTPREAVKTAKGREQLAELLKHIENGEERKRLNGEPSYDVSRLRAALGMPS